MRTSFSLCEYAIHTNTHSYYESLIRYQKPAESKSVVNQAKRETWVGLDSGKRGCFWVFNGWELVVKLSCKQHTASEWARVKLHLIPRRRPASGSDTRRFSLLPPTWLNDELNFFAIYGKRLVKEAAIRVRRTPPLSLGYSVCARRQLPSGLLFWKTTGSCSALISTLCSSWLFDGLPPLSSPLTAISHPLLVLLLLCRICSKELNWWHYSRWTRWLQQPFSVRRSVHRRWVSSSLVLYSSYTFKHSHTHTQCSLFAKVKKSISNCCLKRCFFCVSCECVHLVRVVVVQFVCVSTIFLLYVRWPWIINRIYIG